MSANRKVMLKIINIAH